MSNIMFLPDQKMQNFTLMSNPMSDFDYIAYVTTFWTRYIFVLFHFFHFGLFGPFCPFVSLSLTLLEP